MMAACCVKLTPLTVRARPTPATVTTTAPPLPSGASPTVQLIESLLDATTAHAMPPSVTSGAAPPTPVKPPPWRWTVLPTWPAAGRRLATVGGAVYVKVPATPAARSASPISGTEIVTLSAPRAEAGVAQHTAVSLELLELSGGQATPPMATAALLPLSRRP